MDKYLIIMLPSANSVDLRFGSLEYRVISAEDSTSAHKQMLEEDPEANIVDILNIEEMNRKYRSFSGIARLW